MRDLDDSLKHLHNFLIWLASLVAISVAGFQTLPSRAAGAQPADSTLQVTVSNVRMAAGHIRVVVCTRASFLTETCPFRGMTPAQVGPSS